MKKAILAILAALSLSACASSGDNVSTFQRVVDAARSTYIGASIAEVTYSVLTPCAQTQAKVCYDPGTALVIRDYVQALGAAVETAQAALDAKETGSTLAEKVKLASTAAVTALKILQKFGVG